VAEPLLINFIHDVDDLRFVAGEITAVQAFNGETPCAALRSRTRPR